MKRPKAFRLRRWCGAPLCLALLAAFSQAQAANLQQVLDRMDEAATNFRTTQADFTWTQYNKVINDITDTQEGDIYFRRNGKEIQMAAEISKPEAKLVVFSDGKIQMYQPKIEQVDVYDAGAHREEFESFLVLGFGGGGHDLLKSFEVKFLGSEKVDGIEAAKLDLVPKAERVKQSFAHITLWIDPARGVSVQQQLFETSGDYRLAKYFNIQVNQKIPDSAFKLKTSSKTKIITH
jgi:outer membrane lipoprotein-sorting protein